MNGLATFWRGVFSDNGSPSASRVMMGFHAILGGIVLLHVAFHNHAAPDAVTMAGITGFVVAPYGINAIRNAMQGPQATPPQSS